MKKILKPIIFTGGFVLSVYSLYLGYLHFPTEFIQVAALTVAAIFVQFVMRDENR